MYGRKRPISVQIWFLEKGREVRYAFLTTAAVASVHRKADSGEKEPGRRHEEDLIQGKKTWQKETWPKGRKYGGMDMGMDRNRDAVYQTVSHRTDSHQTGTGDGKETAGKWNIGNRNAGSKTTGLRRRILKIGRAHV